MLSVELDHVSQLLSKSAAATVQKSSKIQVLASETSRLSKEIKDAIYKYGLIDHPTYGKIFACEYRFIMKGVHCTHVDFIV